jgi:hypothetical protein
VRNGGVAPNEPTGVIPAQRQPGEPEFEPATAPLRQMTTTALFDRIPQQRTGSPFESRLESPVEQTIPNPALVARMAPRRPRPLVGVLAVLGGAALAVVAILLLVLVLGALI